MARVKKAIIYIRNAIKGMRFREEEQVIAGMIIMANLLGAITEDERETLENTLEEAYFELEC